MTLPPAPCDNTVHVWTVALRASDPALSTFHHILSSEEKYRGSRFAYPALQRRYTLSHGVLRLLLSKYLDTSPAEITFRYGPSGKPFLQADRASLQFNMSHSETLAAYAFGHESRLGIDIERLRPMPDLEGVAKLSFSQKEYADLRELREPDRTEAFFRCWTRKEAYTKAVGQGLSLALDSFHVGVRPGEPAHIQRSHSSEACDGWQIHDIVQEGYLGAVVAEEPSATTHRRVEQQPQCTAGDLAGFL